MSRTTEELRAALHAAADAIERSIAVLRKEHAAENLKYGYSDLYRPVEGWRTTEGHFILATMYADLAGCLAAIIALGPAPEPPPDTSWAKTGSNRDDIERSAANDPRLR